MVKSFVGAAACLAVSAAMTQAVSQSIAANRDVFAFNSIAIPCWIENEKVIAVVNATGKTIAAGSTLRVDAVRLPDGGHFALSRKIGRTQSGAVIRIGAVRSSSCTATVKMQRPNVRTE